MRSMSIIRAPHVAEAAADVVMGQPRIIGAEQLQVSGGDGTVHRILPIQGAVPAQEVQKSRGRFFLGERRESVLRPRERPAVHRRT